MADYLQSLKHAGPGPRHGLPLAPKSVKRHLSAIRHFFDLATVRHAVLLNPAKSVRGPRVDESDGKTQAIPESQVAKIFACIDTCTPIGLRDRAIMATFLYTAARRAAVVNLDRGDYFSDGAQMLLRFHEKNGKTRDIPVRHDLQLYLDAYLRAAGIDFAFPHAPLFRAGDGRSRDLSERRISGGGVYKLAKRKFRAAGLGEAVLSTHSWRVTTLTNLFENGLPLQDIQDLAGHNSAKTTRGYDRRGRKVTRNLVERITL